MNTINSLSEFREAIENLMPMEFEQYVFELFEESEDFENVQQNQLINSRQVDIVVTEKQKGVLSEDNRWAVEVKKYRQPITINIIDSLIGLLQALRFEEFNINMLLVTSSSLTHSAMGRAIKNGIRVWELKDLFEKTPKKLQEKVFGREFAKTLDIKVPYKKEDIFIHSLKSINPGKEEWLKYQQSSAQIFEHLFCPPLETPKYELLDSDERNRRDVIFENASTDGFWKMVRENYLGHYVVVDAKNYKNPLTKRPIIDIAHYLKPYGCGMFGIILSRKGAAASATHAMKEQWIGNNKLIVVLSDDDMIEMLRLKAISGYPDGVIRAVISEFRMSL